jgi:uncharacterized protein YgbK (DUF1537 family)
VKVGVIADDLTGAAELGAVGLRHGLRAEVILSGEPDGEAQLACIDTDSRSCDAAEAAQRVSTAARQLQGWGAQWIYKKTDSVLRGNVTPEIEALLETLGLPGALLVPANPSLGRTIVGGQYFIQGQFIHQTHFAQDPKHPRLSPFALELLDKPARFGLSLAQPGRPLPPDGIVLGEVSSSHDLQKWAASPPTNWLRAGGAEFFGALLTPCASLTRWIPKPGRELFVCGSATDATRRFVADQARRGLRVFSLPPSAAEAKGMTLEESRLLEIDVIRAFQTQKRLILEVGLPLVNDNVLAERLAEQLVQVAEGVLGQTEIPRVFVEGGATAVSLARRLGWSRLSVVEEFAPGVVALGDARSDPGDRVLIMKPGSYAWPETLLET